jgi:hypothetical protein
VGARVDVCLLTSENRNVGQVKVAGYMLPPHILFYDDSDEFIEEHYMQVIIESLGLVFARDRQTPTI